MSDYVDEALNLQRQRYVKIRETICHPVENFRLSMYHSNEPNLHYDATIIPLDQEWVIIALFYKASDNEYHPYMVFFYRDMTNPYPIWIVDHIEAIDGDVWTNEEMPSEYLVRLDSLWVDAKNAILGIWS